jgi:alpha-beta hydrolase superfamily lysophospholipase
VRRGVIIVAGAAVAVSGLIVLGPRAHVDWDETAAPEVPDLDELDAWLAARESRFDDLVPGTDKRIVWHEGRVATTTTAVVYLHGFSASRQELAPVPERVAAALRANLFETRLAGHGRTGEALASVDAEAWVADYREALEIGRRLGERVVVLGCSTGATLDAIGAAYWPQRVVAAHVWISPNFGLRSSSARLLTWPWARTWIPWVTGDRRTWEPANEQQGRYWTTSYPIEALFPMQALVEVSRVAPLDRIRAPTLVVHSTDDPVIRPDAVVDAYRRLGAEPKDRVAMSGAEDPHVLAGAIMSPGNTDRVVDRIVEFVEGVSKK